MDILSTLRDVKRIMDKNSVSGLNRCALLNTYFRLNRISSKVGSDKKTQVLDFRVNFLDDTMLRLLYRHIFVNRIYELPLESDEPIILDCGSNIGMSILFFKSLYPKARIIGFEPHPSLYKILESNIEENNLINIKIFRTALSDKTGTLNFFVNDENNPGSVNMGFIQREQSAKPISVKTDLLSNYVGNRVDLVKLDIEGAEENVLRDLFENNKLSNIRRIVCEFHHHIHINECVDRFSQVLNILESAGFGYQISAYSNQPIKYGAYQDIMIYAFNKAAE